MNHLIAKILAILLTLAVTSCASHTTVRQNQRFNPQELVNSTVVALPTEAIINTVDFANKKERMYDYELYFQDIINQSLVNKLSEFGIKVTLVTEKNIYDQGFANKFQIVRENYQANIDNLYRSYTMPTEKAFAITNSLGKDNLIYSNHNHILLLSSYTANTKTTGARTRDFIFAALAGNNNNSQNVGEEGTIIVALIDSLSGDILWSNSAVQIQSIFHDVHHNMFSSYDEADRKKADLLAERVLQPLFAPKK